MQYMKITGIFYLLMGICFWGGCSSGQDTGAQSPSHEGAHDHEEHTHSDDDHPEDYVSAVTKLQTLNDVIKNAFAEDDMKKADPPVHEIGHILESVHSLAEQASFSASDKKSIDTAVESLFEAYAAIDEKLHGGKGASYSDVERKIKPALEFLNDKANSLKEKTE